ncbi:hypothetical protein PBRA_000145 [Plasmodiophora brassicae]|nr:hypothetical protein PBRA_000145 [Plasmodiophora brassicae]
MRRGLLRLSSRARRLPSRVRLMTTASGSDDDFKPVWKEPAPPLDPETGVLRFTQEPAVDVIKKDITSSEVFLYMKGTPEAPQCGFSHQVVAILQHYGVPFKSRNILEYPAIREEIKRFSDWPTIPQLYVRGQFVGGCDIITQMYKSGEIKDVLPMPESKNDNSNKA